MQYRSAGGPARANREDSQNSPTTDEPSWTRIRGIHFRFCAGEAARAPGITARPHWVCSWLN